MSTSKKNKNRRAKVDSEGIDYSDIPELGSDFWKNAKLIVPALKKSVSIRIDPDVLAWFKSAGKGYQSRMNAVLRSYMLAKR